MDEHETVETRPAGRARVSRHTADGWPRHRAKARARARTRRARRRTEQEQP
ncbi:hypothetical protein M3697_05350 [Janibacter melonis]|uniref:hypothetical protein n=1 Tax=Janibacter melonis TaxID=262209 RepID=UPI002043B094|nr:hypothetical protein [Janibacter melonis]MCM3554532.1 hypothetical protein [Janibacter melonis]